MKWSAWTRVFTGILIAAFYCLIAHLLLIPGTGRSNTDVSLYPDYDQLLILILISYLMLAANYCFIVIKTHRFMSLLLLIFAIFVVIRCCFFGLELQSLNIAVNLISIAPCFFLVYSSSKSYIGSKYFPAVLFGVYVIYSVKIALAIISSQTPNGIVYHFHSLKRLSIVFNNPNHLGGFLAFGVLFFFALIVVERNSIKRCLFFVLINLLILGLMRTYCRGAWISCLVGLTISIALFTKIGMAKRAMISTALLVICVIVLNASTYGAIFQRSQESMPSRDKSVGNRLRVWKAAIYIIKDNFLIGVGVGVFGDILERSYTPPSLSKQSYCSAMNNVITIAAETGVFSALVYLICLVDSLVIVKRLIYKRSVPHGIAIGMFCGIVSLFIFSCSTYTAGRLYATILTWGSIGFLLGYSDKKA